MRPGGRTTRHHPNARRPSFFEHKQGRRLRERLVLARQLALELLDPLGIARGPPPLAWLRKSLLERARPFVELLAVQSLPPEELSELALVELACREHCLRALQGGPVLRPLGSHGGLGVRRRLTLLILAASQREKRGLRDTGLYR